MPDTNPLRLFSSLQPRLSPAVAGNGMMFASAGGGGAPGYNPVQGGSEYPEDVETPATRGSRGDQGNIPAGRQRTVHFQPEERYWTDYLRIALPVIGLVLMLGLFWYWASTFIGGPSKKEPVSTQTPGQSVIANAPASPTAAATRAPVVNQPSTAKTPASNPGTGAGTPASANQPAANTTTGGDNQAAGNSGNTTNNQQATQPASGTTFAADETVTTTDSVNLRSGPSTGDSALTTLNAGDSLTIVSGPEAGDNYQWYQVKTSDGTTGWVASDFIQKAGG